MSDVCNSPDLVAILLRVATALEAERDRLTDLDAAVGDGDLGVTMAIGCRAVRETLTSVAGSDVGAVLLRAGSAFGGAAASTMGVLIATALMRAGKAAQDLTELGTPDLARLARAALEGIQQRGKSRVGDKTVLDALAPAVTAMEEAAQAGLSLAEAAARAALAARAGAEATTGMRASAGRAGWLQERSVGHADPGAVTCALALEFLAREFAKGG